VLLLTRRNRSRIETYRFEALVDGELPAPIQVANGAGVILLAAAGRFMDAGLIMSGVTADFLTNRAAHVRTSGLSGQRVTGGTI
jgi:hypothetical protein